MLFSRSKYLKLCDFVETELDFPSHLIAPRKFVRKSARAYDVKGGAFFSKNRLFGTTHGDAWTPRLWSPSLIMAPGDAPGINKW